MPENEYGVELSIDEELENAAKEASKRNVPIVLHGYPFSGKTMAIKRARNRGVIPDDYEHIQLEKPMRRDYVEKIRKEIEKSGRKVIIEGSNYQIQFLRGKKEKGLLSSLLGGKEERVEEVILGGSIFVEVKIKPEDSEKLFNYFAERAGLRKEELDGKKDVLLELASWGGPPSEGGLLIPPLLEKVIIKYAKIDKKHLERIKKLEGDGEKLLLGSFGYLISRSAPNIGEILVELARSLALELLTQPADALLVISSILGFYKERKDAGLGKYIELYKAWNRCPEEKRRILCEKLDEKYGLDPGESYIFLSSWLSGDFASFKSRIERLFTDEYIEKLNKAVEGVPELGREVEEINKEINNIIEEIKKIKKEIKQLESKLKEVEQDLQQQQILHGIYRRPEEDPYVKPEEGKFYVRVGGKYELAKTGNFEELSEKVLKQLDEEKLVVLTGPSGSGKSILAHYIVVKWLSREKLIKPKAYNLRKVEKVDELLNAIEDAGALALALILYDPSDPSIYIYPPADKEVRSAEEEIAHSVFVLLSRWRDRRFPLLIVLPTSLYEHVEASLKGRKDREGAFQFLQDFQYHTLHFDKEMERERREFIKQIVRNYSGCENIDDIASLITEKFEESYTLVAKHTGLLLRDKSCRVEDVQKLLEKAQGDAEKSIKFLVEAQLGIKAAPATKEKLLKRYGKLLLLRNPFLGLSFGKYIATPTLMSYLMEKIGIPEDDIERNYVWLSMRNEDLVEKALKELVKAAKEADVEVLDSSTAAKYIVKKWHEDAEKVTLEKLRSAARVAEDEAHWRRCIYILGCALFGYPFNTYFSQYKELKNAPEIADSCEADELLMEGEVPPLDASIIRQLVIEEIGEGNPLLEPIGQTCEMTEEARKLFERMRSPALLPYFAGLALAGLKQCQKDAPYLLKWVLYELGSRSDLEAVAEMLHAIGKALYWPGELAPLLFIMVDRYITFEPKLRNLLEETALKLHEKGKLEVWSKAYLAEVFSRLAFMENNVSLSNEALSLLEEIKQDDTLLHIASAYVNNHLTGLYMRRGDLDKARKCLNEYSKALEGAKALTSFLSENLSENVRNYLMFIKAVSPEEAIQSLFQKIEIFYKFRLAQLYENEGLLKGDREKLEEAEKIHLEVAEECYKSGNFRDYLTNKDKALMVRVLLADRLSEELRQNFREPWEDWEEAMKLGFLLGDLRLLPFSLAYYLVALALTGGNWKEMLNKYGFFLSYAPQLKVATLLLLSLMHRELTLALSKWEIYKAIEAEVSEELRPALMLSLHLINEEEARKLCNDIKIHSRRICNLFVNAVLGRNALGSFRKQVLDLLNEEGVDIEKIEREKLSELELVELMAPHTMRGTFILLLKALADGNYRLARAHALRLSALPLYGKLYDALKAEELNDEVKLCLAKLYYYHF